MDTEKNGQTQKDFLDLLHRPTHKPAIKVHQGHDYLPISYVQAELDNVFMGGWETRNFHYQVIANEVTGSVELHFYHPVFDRWMCRMGAASVPIQLKSGSSVTDVDKKIPNALQKNLPSLLSECLKNAAKSIGVRFGRDLNRDFYDTAPERFDDLEKWSQMISECNSLADLNSLYLDAKSNLGAPPTVIERAFKERQIELKSLKA